MSFSETPQGCVNIRGRHLVDIRSENALFVRNVPKRVEIKSNMWYNSKCNNIAVASNNEMRCAEMSENITERFISVKEAAEYLGVTRNTVLNYISDRGLPALKIGKLWKIKPSELDKWIEDTNKK